MRRAFVVIALFTLGFADFGSVVGPALAVMETAPVRSSPSSSVPSMPWPDSSTESVGAPFEPSNGRIMRLDIPVAWQLTRARMVSSGASSMTESFRETWTLEIRPSGELFLQSPRARVAVFAHGAALAPSSDTTGLPGAIVIAEQDFAQLVGIRTDTVSTAEGEAAAPTGGFVGTPITLQLARPAKGGSDYTLSWSEDEHFAVHIDVGANTAF